MFFFYILYFLYSHFLLPGSLESYRWIIYKINYRIVLILCLDTFRIHITVSYKEKNDFILLFFNGQSFSFPEPYLLSSRAVSGIV